MTDLVPHIHSLPITFTSIRAIRIARANHQRNHSAIRQPSPPKPRRGRSPTDRGRPASHPARANLSRWDCAAFDAPPASVSTTSHRPPSRRRALDAADVRPFPMNPAEFPSLANGSGLGADLAKHPPPPPPPPISIDTAVTAAEAQGEHEHEHEPVVIDAGLRSLDHYRRSLPRWRYDMRQRALPLIRWETPYLAWLQAKLRSPALDSYFAITANLGTHTFFMIGLPIMFWCGYASFGKGIVHILATGVFFTGFVKDFFSLPRPLSPPLHRITMSGSAALEYGFPSTHSANAVSVAVYSVLCLRAPDNPFQPGTKTALEALSYFYAASIIFGRLYCGMHGFVDVVVGSVFGAALSLIQFYCGSMLDDYLDQNGWTGVFAFVLLIIVLVRVHPEPADDCPCFDDSVAFAGVMIGLEVGIWHFARLPQSGIPFDLHALGWPAVTLRVLFGVLVVFAWREVAKPALLRGLPHLFRLIETWGLSLPRRFFMPASEYKHIPLRLRVDNVMPSVSDLPGLITAVRHPRRGRSVSIGPQSAADAYETLAYRERRRRESIGSNNSNGGNGNSNGKQDLKTPGGGHSSAVSPLQQQQQQNSGNSFARPGDFEKLMGEGTVVFSPVDTAGGGGDERTPATPAVYVGQQDELGEKEVFSKLVKPRVRYDVEVITKLVVYAGTYAFFFASSLFFFVCVPPFWPSNCSWTTAGTSAKITQPVSSANVRNTAGIAWFAVEGVPVLYELIPGLGAGHLQER
ncbi:PAP2-domain-containing protein [Xylariaceae sp. FL0804]|nr:PAP2-domain-containing protein [Xylariaceae sp. FL0804]